MNLKEAFRYQKYLDTMVSAATTALRNKQLCMDTTRVHYHSKADATVADVTEVEDKIIRYRFEDVVDLILQLIDERRELTHQINVAKHYSMVDIDSLIEANKFTTRLTYNMKIAFGYQPGKRKEQGRGYRLNVEGAQVPYVYDIDVEEIDAYARSDMRSLYHDLSKRAEQTSTEIDSAMVNTEVNYEPKHDVTETFDDIMEGYINKRKATVIAGN